MIDNAKLEVFSKSLYDKLVMVASSYHGTKITFLLEFFKFPGFVSL